MSGYRLPSGGSHIDREKTVEFTFDGKKFSGFAGDTLASALLSSGQMIFARSFKYHRPRGVVSDGGEESGALVSVGTSGRHEPNVRATETMIAQGLVAKSQNSWPSLSFDLMAVNDKLSNLFSAGFYYKTFMGPTKKAWHLYEHFIRKAAGMGSAGTQADPDRYEHQNAFPDILIVGAGPAGLQAAYTAMQSGAKVLLLEQKPTVGGYSLEENSLVGDEQVSDWVQRIYRELETADNVTMLTQTTVYGYFDSNVMGAVEKFSPVDTEDSHVAERHWTIKAKRIILSTGAIERPIVFNGNDIPGVMLASACARYASRYGVAVGKEIVVFTNNDSGYRSALTMAKAGVNVVALVDAREDGCPALIDDLHYMNISVHQGAVVCKAHGGKHVKAVTISRYDAATQTVSGRPLKITCDALAVSGGWTPTIHLTSQFGDKPIYKPELAAFVPGAPTRDWMGAGSMMGLMTLGSAIESGHNAACKAISNIVTGCSCNVSQPGKVSDCVQDGPLLPLWEVPSLGGKEKKFVDLQHDVTASDVRLAKQEGYLSVEHLKRYTTLGMAPDQGKTSNMNGLAIMAAAQNLPIPEVGTTRFRPPFAPVRLGTLAGSHTGKHLQPRRRSPLHEWHTKNGAEFLHAGLWLRARAYPAGSETLEDACAREAAAVRSSVGIVDVSTLGKIDVQGPDSSAFLNRIYVNAFAKVPVGKARYGIMLRDDGMVFDDGTVWRLSENQFLMTTTTANAGPVLNHLEYLLEAVWPDLKVHVTSSTDQWAGMAVAGPKARAVLSDVVEGLDMVDASVPFMAVREGSIEGIPVYVARLSFSGELAYEVYCTANQGIAVWEAIFRAGEKYDITPYGSEALGTLRIEKGHISGPELNGRTTPFDLGFDRFASRKKDYVGRPMFERAAFHTDERKQLVGLMSTDHRQILEGSQILAHGSDGPALGHITSATYSPALKNYIALALIEGGLSHKERTLRAAYPLKDMVTPVEVVDPCFVDKEGARLHV